MIYQSGYLTIKEYDSRRNRYLLDFPNNEVKKGFLTMVAANYFKPQEFEVSNWIVDAVILLEEGETTAFCSALTSFLADIPYDSHGSIKTVEATENISIYFLSDSPFAWGILPVACGENSVKRKSGLCIGDKGLCIYI